MEHLKKIAKINMIILLIYTVLIHVAFLGANSHDRAMVILLLSMYVIFFHVMITFLIALLKFYRKDKPLGKAYLLTSLIVLVIGFSSCWGSAMLSTI